LVLNSRRKKLKGDENVSTYVAGKLVLEERALDDDAAEFGRTPEVDVVRPLQTHVLNRVVRVARFFLVQNTNAVKNISNVHKKYQMDIK
jgi:hypothetical protein